MHHELSAHGDHTCLSRENMAQPQNQVLWKGVGNQGLEWEVDLDRTTAHHLWTAGCSVDEKANVNFKHTGHFRRNSRLYCMPLLLYHCLLMV